MKLPQKASSRTNTCNFRTSVILPYRQLWVQVRVCWEGRGWRGRGGGGICDSASRMGGRAGGCCAPHMRGGSSILESESPETPHWLCHRPIRLHSCSIAIPPGWESGSRQHQIQILSSASDSAEAPNSNVKLGLAPVCRIRRILPFYVMKPRFSRSQGSRIPH